MINFCTACRQKVGDLLDHNYYIQERGVLHGLPISIIASIAMGYGFAGLGIATSLTYALGNYSVITFLIELENNLFDNTENEKRDYLFTGLNTGVAYILSIIFVNTVLKTHLTYLLALPLAVGAFVGSYARKWAWDYENKANMEILKHQAQSFKNNVQSLKKVRSLESIKKKFSIGNLSLR